MKKKITTNQLIKQLKADLIGKDSYRGITLTYAWLANQFGHFSLGFIPTLLLFFFLKTLTQNPNAVAISCLVISILWLVFELYNFLGPLLFKRNTPLRFIFLGGEKYIFKPQWRNIAFDTFTDLCFFWIGSLTAAFLLEPLKIFAILDIALIFIIAYPSFYWFYTKMCQQYAYYPFQFRLSQWGLKISENDKEIVESFISDYKVGKHLLIFGSKKSGKTSLAVGIGNELSIKHEFCFYTTSIKLFSMFFEKGKNDKSDTIWDWRMTNLLIIDDINPGEPIKEELVTPTKFLSYIDGYSESNMENREALCNKSILWILGNEDKDKELLGKWSDLLMELGIQSENISSINLLK